MIPSFIGSPNSSVYINKWNYAEPIENRSSYITHQVFKIAMVYFVTRVEICGMNNIMNITNYFEMPHLQIYFSKSHTTYKIG
jgi:hypothetical protein